MTCIVGVQGFDGKVWIGGDSHVEAGCETFPMTDVERKVFRRGDMLFGVTGSTRIRQLLEHQVGIPKRGGDDLTTHVYLINHLMPAIKDAIDEYGGVKINDQNEGWDFLLGYRGQLWYGCHDLSVSLMPEYAAVGCGHMIALGSLYTTAHPANSGGTEPTVEQRLLVALDAAAEHDVHVDGPFQIECVG